jgi:sugar phosphate isomerase/epimerase
MDLTRRDLGRLALWLPVLGLSARSEIISAAVRQLPKPNSVFGGVIIGINSPYSFGNEANDAAAVLRAHLQVGASAVELRADMAELFAGAPASAGRGRGPRAAGPGAAGAVGPTEGAELRDWRTSVSMDKYGELRKTYEEAGVRICAFRFTLAAQMTDAEYDYAFNAAKSLGANQITMEMPGDANVTKRIGEFATRHQIYVGYHLHTTATLTSWDVALAQSKFNAAQVDVGHYVAGTGENPIPLLKKHARQIASLHLKDRKSRANGGTNMSWGQGDTPLKEILQFMKQQRATYPAFIELEHMSQLPPGSNRMVEVFKCVEFCRAALS